VKNGFQNSLDAIAGWQKQYLQSTFMVDENIQTRAQNLSDEKPEFDGQIQAPDLDDFDQDLPEIQEMSFFGGQAHPKSPASRRGLSNIRLAEPGRQFGTAGLVVDADGRIPIDPKGPARWEEVSQYIRIRYKMPPAASPLESIHGHLNEATPPRHSF
jgi:hypothetical protein